MYCDAHIFLPNSEKFKSGMHINATQKMYHKICRAHKLPDFDQNLQVKKEVCMKLFESSNKVYDVCLIKRNIFF